MTNYYLKIYILYMFYIMGRVLHFFINEATIKFFSITKLLNNESYKSKINYTININKINKMKQ